MAALVAVAAVALVLALTAARGQGGPPPCRSALIPAYLRPDALNRIAARPTGGRIVVVNPDNGPGAALQPDYRSAIAAQQRAGTRVLGYVHTGWGTRDPAAVRADAVRYHAWYGVDGVFLDEAAHDEPTVGYYAALARDARADGLPFVALNPGTVPARAYFALADVVVTFEGPYAEYAAAVARTPDWLREIAPARIAHLVYGASREQALSAAGEDSAGFVYATGAGLPDPWSALPPYLEDFEARLDAC